MKEIEEGKRALAISISEIIKTTYWKIGRHIVEFEQDGNKRAKYGTAMLSNLAKLLRARVGRGYSRPNLNNMRKFYLMFPKCQTSDKSLQNFQTSDKLTWSHICELLTIDDDLEREFYTKECIAENWSVDYLHPKNPHLANFFVQMGRGEHLGSGVLNLYHYAPLYMGAEPTITDDDMFRIHLNIAESKRAELAMLPISNPDTESSEKSVQKTIQKTIQKSGVEHGVDKLTDRQHVIMSLIRQFVVEHVVEGGVEDGVEKLSARIIAQKLKSSSRTIQRELSYLQEKGLIRRIGSDAKGYFAIVE